MRLTALLWPVVALAGCATSGVVDPPAFDTKAACAEAARLSGAGEHQPAVDALRAVQEVGATCSRPILAALEESERRLSEADDWARAGLEARKRGDLATAGESFRRALEAYPKYYWVRKLARSLEVDARATTALALSKLEESRTAQQAGNLSLAITKLEEAIEARPEPPVRADVVDLGRRLGLSLFSSGELGRARDLWQATLALDPDNQQIRRYLEEVERSLRNLEAIKDDD